MTAKWDLPVWRQDTNMCQNLGDGVISSKGCFCRAAHGWKQGGVLDGFLE